MDASRSGALPVRFAAELLILHLTALMFISRASRCACVCRAWVPDHPLELQGAALSVAVAAWHVPK
jgi:hypothetical protein